MRLTRKAFGLLASACACALTGVAAIQENVVGVVDWHQPQLGIAILSPTPPRIVKAPGDQSGGLVVSITQSNVLGAVHEDTGKIAWRHQFDAEDSVISFHIQASNVLLLSGPSAATARLFSLATGHLLWETTLHDARSAQLVSPHYLGTTASFTEHGDVLVISEGRKVFKLSAAAGSKIWTWELESPAGETILNQLHIQDDIVHLLGLTSSFTSKTLSDITLSLTTGQTIGSQTPQKISSSIRSPEDVIILTSGNKHVTYVWLEEGVAKTFSRAETAGKVRSIKTKHSAGRYTKLIKTEEASQLGYVLIERADGAADVLDSRDGKFRIAKEFDPRLEAADGEGSIYGAVVSNGMATFTRIDWATSLQLLRVEKIAMAGDAKTTVLISSYTLPFDTKNHGVVLHSTVGSFDEVIEPVDPSERPEVAMLGRQHNAPGQRFLFITSTGASQYWQLGGVKWTREESLADVRALRFVELGEPEVEDASGVMAGEDFVHRLLRHVAELKDLPNYAMRFVSRFTSAGDSSLLTSQLLSIDKLHRDQFGFQKLVIVATGAGKLFALDSANGNVVWSRLIAFSGPGGSDLDVKAMWNVRNGTAGAGGPVVAVLGERLDKTGFETVVIYIDAYTGVVAGEADVAPATPLGRVVFAGSHRKAFLLPFENCSSTNKVLAIVDRDLQLHMFPKCAKMAKKIQELGPKLHFSLSRRTPAGDSLRGYTLAGESSALGVFPTVETWSIALPSGSSITSVKPLPSGAIASFGRVLGDKSTLYKYLNPHLLVITTVKDKDHTGGVKVIDEASGNIVYEISLDHIDVAAGVKAHIVENWLVYHWLEPQDGAGNGGWRMASVELYEDRTLEDKAKMPGLSVHALGHGVMPISQTFVFPGNAVALTTTDSKFGITAKDVIYVNEQHQVATMPRRLLDPRRPTGKPTSGDKEEMLIPYDPVLPPDSRRVVSHKYEVLGVKDLHTSPALLESTSLLLATGLDLFLTRGVNPSGTFDILSDSFNKAQLILTIIGLTVGISIAGPAVKRKMLRARWY